MLKTKDIVCDMVTLQYDKFYIKAFMKMFPRNGFEKMVPGATYLEEVGNVDTLLVWAEQYLGIDEL